MHQLYLLSMILEAKYQIKTQKELTKAFLQAKSHAQGLRT
jgi:hypothetical protein